MGIYTYIQSWTNYELFRNIVIILLCIFIFIGVTVGLNIILALVLGVIIVLYLTQQKDVKDVKDVIDEADEKDSSIESMAEAITPTPVSISKEKDITDFLFSIQDFYVFNPQAYEEMIDNIDAFITLGEKIFGNCEMANYYYQIAESKKNNALNALHSIIFKLPNNEIFVAKLDGAHKRLETILNKYLNEMYNQCNYYIKKNGLDVNKRQINIGPKEWNRYLDKDFTYQIY